MSSTNVVTNLLGATVSWSGNGFHRGTVVGVAHWQHGYSILVLVDGRLTTVDYTRISVEQLA